MSGLLTDAERRRLVEIIDLHSKGDNHRRKGHKFYRAKALLALDQGRPIQDVADLLRAGLIEEESEAAKRPEPLPEQPRRTFEQDLDYVLEKNAELYRRLAR